MPRILERKAWKRMGCNVEDPYIEIIFYALVEDSAGTCCPGLEFISPIVVFGKDDFVFVESIL